MYGRKKAFQGNFEPEGFIYIFLGVGNTVDCTIYTTPLFQERNVFYFENGYIQCGISSFHGMTFNVARTACDSMLAVTNTPQILPTPDLKTWVSDPPLNQPQYIPRKPKTPQRSAAILRPLLEAHYPYRL